MTRACTILYHDVVETDWDSSGFPGAAAARYKLTRQAFDDHIAAIAARLHAPARLLAPLAVDDGPARIPFLFTVDDGGSSALHIADIIERRHWRGYFFITTERIGTPSFVTKADLRELHARGHAVGSHSATHPYRMAALDDDRLHAEWRESAATIADTLGLRTTTASVPGGFYSPRVTAAAAAEGITVLFNSEPSTRITLVNGCRVLGRFNVYRDTKPTAAAALASGDLLATCRQRAEWETKKLLKATAGPVWDGVRTIVFSRRG